MYPRNTPLTVEEKEEIRRLYLEVNNQKIVAEMLGHSTTTVWKTLKGYGLNKGQGGNQVAQMKITDEQLVEAVQKMTTKEIAAKYSIHETNVLRRCKKLGIKPVTSPKSMVGLKQNWGRYENLKVTPHFGECWHYVSSFAVKCNELHPEFVYLETRRTKSSDAKRVRLKCKACNTVIERAESTVRQKNIECDCCKRNQQLQDERIKLMRFFIALKESQEPKICACCGKQFFSQYAVTLYCSDKCKRKAKKLRYKERNPDKRKQQDRHYIQRARKYGCVYEYGITRAKVAKRDNNVCQICGKVCNPLDKTWGDFGPDYPTLDHIIPLAKGGPHLWENVQCACGECNSNKRDLYTVKREEVWT